jgi:Ca-activated chloride channel family protein
MSFEAPLSLLTLLLLPALLVFLLLMRHRASREAVAFTNLELLVELAGPRRSWRHWLPVVLFLLAVGSAAAATAKPQARFTDAARHTTVVLLVDVSGSMSSQDVEPTRLDAAATAMKRFLDRLPARVDVGLVQFSTEAEVLHRPTDDHQLVRETIGYLLPEAGTAIGDGLAKAVSLFRGPGAIVLLSDGSQNQGRLTPLEGAARARAADIPVDTIALGTPGGRVLLRPGESQPVPPDPMLMRAIAHATGGHSYAVGDADRLRAVYEGLGGTIVRKTVTREISSWFAFAAGALLLGAVGLGRLVGAVLP